MCGDGDSQRKDFVPFRTEVLVNSVSLQAVVI